MRSKEDYLN